MALNGQDAFAHERPATRGTQNHVADTGRTNFSSKFQP